MHIRSISTVISSFTNVITRRILYFPRQAKTQYQCLKYLYGAFIPLLYCRDRLEKNLRAPYPNRTGIRCLEGTCVTFTPMVQILDTLIISCYLKCWKYICCMCRQSQGGEGRTPNYLLQRDITVLELCIYIHIDYIFILYNEERGAS